MYHKIKLTKLQDGMAGKSIGAEKAREEQAQTAVLQLNAARDHRQDVLAMILDANQIDKKSIPPSAPVRHEPGENGEPGYLIIGEEKAAERIKKAMAEKKTLKKKPRAKA
jgi:hypothetical protein